MPPELTRDLQAKKRFLQEAQAAAALDHPNICTIHEINEFEGQMFIVMTYIKGQSLKERIALGPIKVEEALDISTQVADGLRAAHEQGIIHRDIKPANIMLPAKGQAKIMDFGLAKLISAADVTKTLTVMGTIAYMSPEQVQGQAVDLRTDIWSLGVVLYEMLTGKLPFKGDREASIMYSIEHLHPRPIKELEPNIPPDLEKIVGKTVKKNRGERYQQVGDLLDDLRAVAKGFEPVKLKEVAKRVLKYQRIYLYIAIGVLIVLIALTGYLFRGRPISRTYESIAVLPFKNLSGKPEEEYFVDGMHEALLNQLSKIKALKVISRQSVMQYKGSDKPLRVIARELGADAIVEGSSLRAGEIVQVTAQLIDGKIDRHLWGDEFDRKYSEVLKLQSELARKIADEIKVSVTGEEKKRLAATRSVKPEAYDAYLHGITYRWKSDLQDDLMKALPYFDKAIEIDPEFAPAYLSLASAYQRLTFLSYMSPQETNEKILTAIMKALELDDSLADAHAALGGIRLNEWDWNQAEFHLQHAFDLNPSSVRALAAYSHFLFVAGRFDEGIRAAKREREIEPLLSSNYLLGWCYFYARRYDEAIAELKTMYEKEPNSPTVYWILMFIALSLAEKGTYEEALVWSEKARLFVSPGQSLQFDSCYASICAKTGKTEEARRVFNEMVKSSKDRYVDPYQLAPVCLALGDKEQALQWLEKAYKEHGPTICFLKIDPRLDSLRSNPRFQDLIRRMKFPEN